MTLVNDVRLPPRARYPEGHVSRSVYTIFKLVSASPTSGRLLNEYFQDLSKLIRKVPQKEKLYAYIHFHYLLISCLLKLPVVIFAKIFCALDLYVHPVLNKGCPVVIGGDHITKESGTGLVHTAPGHGLEDYVTSQKYRLPMLSPVNDDGKFTEEAGKFCGLDVLADGNIAVVKYLDEHLSIIMEECYQQKYPYDWRPKKPTIFRATEQWFDSVEGFRGAVMDAIGHAIGHAIGLDLHFVQAENRTCALTSSRSDWCISRQGTWSSSIFAAIISEKVSDAWWYMKVKDRLPDKYHDKASEYEKETDTVDVWFDSGIHTVIV
ncbi:hypothetical protein ACFX2I_013088 [Malus domestica]